MSGVQFMDSSGLGVILGRYRALTERGGRLLLSGVPVSIDRIFRIAGLYALVERA
jgi:stage II sporulation protein AA (anti-sigma F factor antagonist)